MRRLGSRVYVSRNDIQEFMRHWPGSGFEDLGPFWIETDHRGDLVDLSDNTRDFDGSALCALIEDAKEYQPEKEKEWQNHERPTSASC